MRRALPVAALALLLATTAGAEPFTYVNERFGTQATFPAELFTERLPPPDNGDGQTFAAADGARLSVFGRYNVLDQTPQDLVAEARGHAASGYELTYAKAGRDWAVTSGYEGGAIFYQREEFGSDDVIHAVRITYPPDRKAIYDPLVGAIAASLKGP